MSARYRWTDRLSSTVAAVSATAGIVLVTVHPLAAHLQAVSVTPAALLIPNSGEVQLHGHLLGSSITSTAEVVLLTRQRLGTVVPGGRGAQVSATTATTRRSQVLSTNGTTRHGQVAPDMHEVETT